MQQLNGRKFLVALVLLILASCRKDNPPPIDICILDGTGGADCVLKTGEKIWKSPKELENYWATNQEDMANFSSWCYSTSVKNTKPVLGAIRLGLKKENSAD